MSRINTNVQSLVAARIFTNNQAKLGTAMQRLSTGLRINSGKDDPAGLIVSEGMRSDMTGIKAALENASKADSMVSTAEGALNEVSSLLNDLQGLVNASSNQNTMSADEIAANQQQIDSILDTINRISATTEFNGKKLLDGSMDYSTTGVAASAMADLKINSARVVAGGSMSVTVQVVSAATLAKLNSTTSQTGAGTTTIQITGKYGSETYSFASTTKASAMKAAINQATALTGVSAIVSTNRLVLNSTDYGSDSFVTVNLIGGTLAGFATGTQNATGKDPKVKINGSQAATAGVQASIRTGTLSVDVTMTAAMARQAMSKTFTITGGGANFTIGQSVGLANTASIGFQSVATAKLGRGDKGYLASLGGGQTNALSSKNYAQAQRIVDFAINQVASMRGNMGSFQKYTIGSTVNSLNIALENVTAAESAIRDADFAVETASMTRAQILVQAGTSALQMANSAPQSVLSLLR